ncbi:hypothetical protein ACQPVP_15820 [Clostridium nigeriense]|uniref:hypothetical protein n=1 Tax=Clostridium nigeriense TaxID=1805470 RepID=UPI003D341C5B
MVVVYCLECGSEDVKLDGAEKYLICGKCGDRQYIRDLEIGLEEVDKSKLNMLKNGLLSAT